MNTLEKLQAMVSYLNDVPVRTVQRLGLGEVAAYAHEVYEREHSRPPTRDELVDHMFEHLKL